MHINLNAMGTRMKRRRKELKMSQAELAEKVNVSNNHISSIETGKQIPSLTTFVKICVPAHCQCYQSNFSGHSRPAGT